MKDSLQQMQRRYWNGLSANYQRVMRISTDDFHYGPQIPGDSVLGILPEFRPGATALELGCGGGQNSVYLAKRGWRCCAVDISSNQLAHARSLAADHGVPIDFRLSPIESFRKVFPGTFDLVHSSHAFEFVDDPAAVVRSCAAALAPGGTLVVSTVHPLFNGKWVDMIDEDGKSDGMGLFLESYFPPPDDIRYEGGKVDVVSRAYSVSSWFRWFRDAGLEVTRIEEPAEVPPGTVPPYTNEDWADNEGELAAIPGTLIVAGVKRT